jgi:osmotically-inducible protein OsmY
MIVVDSLTLKVEEALMNDHRTGDSVIDVGSYQGIVTLSGWVDSVKTAKAAEEIATIQEGVIRVINSLVVDDSAKEMEYHNRAKQFMDF